MPALSIWRREPARASFPERIHLGRRPHCWAGGSVQCRGSRQRPPHLFKQRNGAQAGVVPEGAHVSNIVTFNHVTSRRHLNLRRSGFFFLRRSATPSTPASLQGKSPARWLSLYTTLFSRPRSGAETARCTRRAHTPATVIIIPCSTLPVLLSNTASAILVCTRPRARVSHRCQRRPERLLRQAYLSSTCGSCHKHFSLMINAPTTSLDSVTVFRLEGIEGRFPRLP